MNVTSYLKATAGVSAAVLLTISALHLSSIRAQADDNSQGDNEQSLSQIGLSIAPSFINMAGKNPELVGLGSFIVNAQADCNGCHGSNPASEFNAGHNPFFRTPLNQTAQFNQATYLAGGQNFGPVGPGVVQNTSSPLYAGPGLGPNIITRNLTPDYTGLPEGGHDLSSFITIMRSGHDYDSLHPNCGGATTDNCYNFPVDGSLLQVMPWPAFRHMTDRQLTAIWTYLSTVPCNAHNDALGNQFPWLKNTCK